MNLEFKKIRLKNFLSFADETFTFDDFGFSLVQGQNKNSKDGALSNGSGKSTLFNGICFALTGETAQGVSSNIENIFADPNDCFVELNLKVDNDEFIITRYKTPRPDLKIIINGEDKSGKGIRDSSKLLSSYLPDITPEMLGGVIILGQGLPRKFSNNTPAGRKEVLEKLTKSDFMIQSIKDLLEKRKEELDILLRSSEDDLLKLNTEINTYEKLIIDCKKSLDEFKDIDLENESLLNEKLINNKEFLHKLELDKNTLETNYKSLQSDSLDNLNNIQLKYESKIEELNQKLVKLSGNIHIKNYELKSLKSEIKKHENSNGVCPTCGQKLPDNMLIDVSELKEKLNNLQQEISNYKLEEEQASEEKINLINAKDAERSKYSESTKLDLDNASSQLTKIQNQIITINNDCFNISKKLDNIKRKREQYDNILLNIDEYNNHISELNISVNTINKKIVDVKRHIRVVMDLISIAKREFRGVLLSNIIKFINKQVKKYAIKVFNNDNFSFELNENHIDVMYCGRLYENLSGGEKTRCDIIIQLALRDLLSEIINIHSNIIVFDEVFDALDALGCEKVINLLFNELKDVSSVYIITHRNDLPISNDNIILVTKDNNGISHIIK